VFAFDPTDHKETRLVSQWYRSFHQPVIQPQRLRFDEVDAVLVSVRRTLGRIKLKLNEII
jgi:hypothetical protein